MVVVGDAATLSCDPCWREVRRRCSAPAVDVWEREGKLPAAGYTTVLQALAQEREEQRAATLSAATKVDPVALMKRQPAFASGSRRQHFGGGKGSQKRSDKGKHNGNLSARTSCHDAAGSRQLQTVRRNFNGNDEGVPKSEERPNLSDSEFPAVLGTEASRPLS